MATPSTPAGQPETLSQMWGKVVKTWNSLDSKVQSKLMVRHVDISLFFIPDVVNSTHRFIPGCVIKRAVITREEINLILRQIKAIWVFKSRRM